MAMTMIMMMVMMMIMMMMMTRVRPGDRVGVGCLVDSCRQCDLCAAGEENFCVKSRKAE